MYTQLVSSRDAEGVAVRVITSRPSREMEEDDLKPEELRLEGLIEDLKECETKLLSDIEVYDKVAMAKRQPLQDQLQATREQLQQHHDLLASLRSDGEHLPDPPGPPSLAWVDSCLFSTACNAVVAMNLAAMAMAPHMQDREAQFRMVDNVFLSWYVFEMSVKLWYHQANLFCGPVTRVWWNYLDAGIVASGVVDQWLLPLFMGGSTVVSAGGLRSLRMFRLFRVMRALKLARALFAGDLSWASSVQFEAFMSGVIGCNVCVMSLELDIEWNGWPFVENAFLLVYSSELVVRLLREGFKGFLFNWETAFWNYLDSTIVLGGMFDLWLTPGILLFRQTVLGEDVEGSSSGGYTRLLKLMRLLRVLRVVRLVRTVKPLYRLLLGCMESFRAMQWVMVLTIVTLYAAAILWTSIVGKDMIYPDGDLPQDLKTHFGTVSASMFSLFRLMNGDGSVAVAITGDLWGQALFVGFMILSNWSILAILTSVVSDNMISSSSKFEAEEKHVATTAAYSDQAKLLQQIFADIDEDRSGFLSEHEWQHMMNHPPTSSALRSATGMTQLDLSTLFSYLAVDTKVVMQQPKRLCVDGFVPARHEQSERLMSYATFIEHLRDDAHPADKRSVLQLMSRMQSMESLVERRLDEVEATKSLMLSRMDEMQSLLKALVPIVRTEAN